MNVDPHVATFAAKNPGIEAASLAVGDEYRWWNNERRRVLKVMEPRENGTLRFAVGRPTRTTAIYVGVHEFQPADRVST